MQLFWSRVDRQSQRRRTNFVGRSMGKREEVRGEGRRAPEDLQMALQGKPSSDLNTRYRVRILCGTETLRDKMDESLREENRVSRSLCLAEGANHWQRWLGIAGALWRGISTVGVDWLERERNGLVIEYSTHRRMTKCLLRGTKRCDRAIHGSGEVLLTAVAIKWYTWKSCKRSLASRSRAQRRTLSPDPNI